MDRVWVLRIWMFGCSGCWIGFIRIRILLVFVGLDFGFLILDFDWIFRIGSFSFADTKMEKCNREGKLIRSRRSLARRKWNLPDEWILGGWAAFGGPQTKATTGRKIKAAAGISAAAIFLSGPTMFQAFSGNLDVINWTDFTFTSPGSCPWHLSGFSGSGFEFCYTVQMVLHLVFQDTG